jgi:hypothetical protein
MNTEQMAILNAKLEEKEKYLYFKIIIKKKKLKIF